MAQIFRQNKARIAKIYGLVFALCIAYPLSISGLIIGTPIVDMRTNAVFLLLVTVILGIQTTYHIRRTYIRLEDDTLYVIERKSRFHVPRADIRDVRVYRSPKDIKPPGKRVNTAFFPFGAKCVVIRITPGSATWTWTSLFGKSESDTIVLFPQDPEQVANAIKTWAGGHADASATRPAQGPDA